ncbi:PAS domain-containing protein [Leptolyngbya sp. FACHB-36]|uniref:CheR family methyltransferase n=1 Tax=Leptolyngbya sp. FACHB-36 TaxID=2692808 RepID=UPI001680AAD4|nr:CheR family methyltransferase [Leptolyngbya sp. FACHB-36]MBD2020062.1 PAS domain-containing protein [Leptolyngbya sp. FACHB-36]
MTKSEANPEFEALLEYVKRNRGFDFTGYKRSSLMRRVNKRMQMVGIDGYNTYLDYLEVHPDEFQHLFNTLLINVTSFFRDHSIWDYAISEMIPLMVSRTAPDEPIRVWTAGCASGEEAYTVAMAIAEVIGIEAFRSRVKIYATDIDDDALSHARQATYLANDLSTVPPELVEKYFEPSDDRYGFRKDLRRSVIFGRHDLIQDAPISKIDLLLCRNVLMYFNAETQARILARFHFALRNGGFLVLGKAEMQMLHANIFSPIDLKRRIFTKVGKLQLRDRLLLATQTDSETEETVGYLSSQVRLREAAFEIALVAGIVVDSNGILVLINERARSLFNLSTRDVGRPLQDLEVSYRPVELRSCIEQASLDQRSITIRNVEFRLSSGEPIYLDVQVSPLLGSDSNTLGISVSFIEVTRYKLLQDELEHFSQELEMAYEELQATNEELETTNEELQSSNEELETTNEELQSTNEELETMNEELQSTNEELQTVNDELQRRSEELNQSNAFLESVFTSLRGGVVVLDSNLQVQIWNHKAEDLWGLRTEEVAGQNFLNLDIGLPVGQLRQSIRDCLIGSPDGAVEVTLDAVNRRGKGIQCRVTCTPLVDSSPEVQGVILLMEDRSI